MQRRFYAIVLPVFLVAGAFAWGKVNPLSAQTAGTEMTAEQQAEFQKMLGGVQEGGGMDVLLEEIERRLETLEKEKQAADATMHDAAGMEGDALEPDLTEDAAGLFDELTGGMDELSFEEESDPFIGLEEPFLPLESADDVLAGMESAPAGTAESWAPPIAEEAVGTETAPPAMDMPMVPAAPETAPVNDAFLPPLLSDFEPESVLEQSPAVPASEPHPAAGAPVEAPPPAEEEEKPAGLLAEMGLFFRAVTEKIAGWFR